MDDDDPSITKLAFKAGGLNEQHLYRIVQEVAARLGVKVAFETGSNVNIHIYLPGVAMAEQKPVHKTTTGDIIGSTVGSVGSARDVTVFMNEVDVSTAITAEEKAALKDARKELEGLDITARSKEDVADYLGKLAGELKQPQRDEGRLKRLIRNIKELAPPVESALAIATSLRKLLPGGE